MRTAVKDFGFCWNLGLERTTEASLVINKEKNQIIMIREMLE